MWFKISKVSTTGGYGCTRSFRHSSPLLFRLHAVLTGMRLNCVSIVTVYNALELRDMLPSPDDTVDARKSASSPSALPRMTTPHCVCLLVPIHEINDFNFVQ